MIKKEYLHNEDKSTPKLLCNLKFLIVDDLPLNREMLKYFIESEDGIALTAADGILALEMFKEDVFDIIIMDIQMPEMDGFEATREIRKLQGGNKIPIIGLSANVLESDKQACYNAGMNGFIPKPLDFKYFLKIVEQCLNSTKNVVAHQDQKTSEIDPQNFHASEQCIPIDIEAYVNRMGGNREIAESIIRGFIKMIPIEIQTIKEAIINLDIKTVDREAHSIKGGAANVFATYLMQAARELEVHAKSDRLDNAVELLEKIRKEYERIFVYAGNLMSLD